MKHSEISCFCLGIFALASLSILGCGQNKGGPAPEKSELTSINSNAKWEQLNSLTDIWFSIVRAIGKDLVAGSYGHGVFRSSDDGRSWQPINQGLPEKSSCVFYQYKIIAPVYRQTTGASHNIGNKALSTVHYYRYCGYAPARCVKSQRRFILGQEKKNQWPIKSFLAFRKPLAPPVEPDVS